MGTLIAVSGEHVEGGSKNTKSKPTQYIKLSTQEGVGQESAGIKVSISKMNERQTRKRNRHGLVSGGRVIRSGSWGQVRWRRSLNEHRDWKVRLRTGEKIQKWLASVKITSLEKERDMGQKMSLGIKNGMKQNRSPIQLGKVTERNKRS